MAKTKEEKRQYDIEYRLKNKERLADLNKKWYEEHKEEISQKLKERRLKDREAFREREKKYYEANREACVERAKEWYQNNKERKLQNSRRWYEKNKERVIQRNKDYRQQNAKLLQEMGLLTDCIVCGFPKEKFAAIEFHHIDPSQKEMPISLIFSYRNFEKIKSEAEKCVCLCSNCHRLYHADNEEVVQKYNEVITKQKGEK